MRYTDPTGTEADPSELNGLRNNALDPYVEAYVRFAWSAVHAEDLQSAFTGFSSAPWKEQLMAGAVGLISVLDVTSNFIGPEKAPAEKVAAVMLGHFPEYLEAGAKANARVFNVPGAIWSAMSDAARWTANQKFLDRAMARGATLMLATDPAKIKAGSYLAREVKYLTSKGFKLVKDRRRLMEVREMSNAVVDEALCAASPLLERGYQLSDQRVYEEHFGNGWVLLTRNDTRIRIVNDRGLWFVEIGSTADAEEWFDARLVLTEISAIHTEPGTGYESLKQLCVLLAETASQWEVLFLPTTFAAVRVSLRCREIASATERFNVIP